MPKIIYRLFLFFIICSCIYFSPGIFPVSLLLILCSEPPGINRDAYSLYVSLNDVCILLQLFATQMFALGKLPVEIYLWRSVVFHVGSVSQTVGKQLV